MRRRIWIGILVSGLAGCVTVKSWQREHHSRRSMNQDMDEGEARFQQHSREAREGASGGNGNAGGGCGCN